MDSDLDDIIEVGGGGGGSSFSNVYTTGRRGVSLNSNVTFNSETLEANGSITGENLSNETNLALIASWFSVDDQNKSELLSIDTNNTEMITLADFKDYSGTIGISGGDDEDGTIFIRAGFILSSFDVDTFIGSELNLSSVESMKKSVIAQASGGGSMDLEIIQSGSSNCVIANDYDFDPLNIYGTYILISVQSDAELSSFTFSSSFSIDPENPEYQSVYII